MDGYFLALGILVGLSIAAPVGPIGFLCIRRTLTCGRLSGLATGLGAATADGLYAIVTAFGLTIISDVLTGHIGIVRILGGIFLIYVGIRTFFSHPAEDPGRSATGSLLRDYSTTSLLTLTNPMTLLAFAGVCAALGIGGPGRDNFSAVLLVAGIVAGSILWWLLLVGGTSLFRSRCDIRVLGLVNRVSGIMICVFGIVALTGIFV